MAEFPGIYQALRARFALPAYVWLEEIRDRPGFNHRRCADGLAMSVWESRGLELEGVEVKTDRRDWLRELKQPEKADVIFPFCDRWWLAIDDPDIVRADELPRTWGLLAPRGDKLVAVREAPKLKPKPISRGLLAMMLRRAIERNPDKEAVEQAVQARLDAERQSWIAHGERNARAELQDLRAIKQAVEEFEKASGVRINAWHGGHNIGRAVRIVMEEGLDGRRKELEGLRSTAKNILGSIDRELSMIAHAGTREGAA